MTARVLQISRPMERLLTPTEVAMRLDVSYDTALQIMRAHGFRPSGKRSGRLYITETKLHAALMRGDK